RPRGEVSVHRVPGEAMSGLEEGAMKSGDAEFHAWLRGQFRTLGEAKAWAWRWDNRHGQRCPGWGGGGGVTKRAMAAHIRMALEGREDQGDGFLGTNYMETKYGPEIYWAMSDREEPA